MTTVQEATNATNTMAKEYLNYIGGEWVKSSSGEWFDNVNPADTTDIVGRFPKSNDRRCRQRGCGGEGCGDKVAKNSGAETCGDSFSFGADFARQQRNFHPRYDARNG